MSELAVTLLRLSYLALLWLFILFTLGVLRRDVFGTTVTPRGPGRPAPRKKSRRETKPARASAASRSEPRRLIVTEGSLTGSAVPLSNAAVIVGRASTCTLVLDDDYASNRHARFFPHEGAWYVEDLDSTNGTFVNGSRIFQATPVPTGTPVRVGSHVMELRR